MTIEWWNLLHKKRVLNKLPARQIFDNTVKPLAKDIESNTLKKVKYLPEKFSQF